MPNLQRPKPEIVVKHHHHQQHHRHKKGMIMQDAEQIATCNTTRQEEEDNSEAQAYAVLQSVLIAVLKEKRREVDAKVGEHAR